MNENLSHTPLEPGVFQGTPGGATPPKPAPRTMRTMKGDMAEAVKSQNETLVSIALAEEKKQAALRAEGVAPVALTAPAPKRIARTLIVLIVLVVIVGLGFVGYYLYPRLSTASLLSITLPSFGTPAPAPTETTTPRTPSLAPSLIPAQSEKRIAIDQGDAGTIFKTVANERTLGLADGSIKNIYFEETSTDTNGTTAQRSISANRLFILTGVPTPEIMTRTLEAPFMVGLVGESGSVATPFLVLKVSGYDTGFAGMLVWEQSLPRFFDALFNENRSGAIGAGIRFRDTVVAGRDARMLATSSGVFAYTFIDPTTIAIAQSQSALEKILSMVK